ncbi:MAG: hypothetical protein WBC67_12870 [Candidatus Acidiferrales bacterium]
MKGRRHRETGGTNEAEEDVKDKPEPRTDAKKIDSEAEELKKGGRAKRKRGGKTEIGKVEGEKAPMHAGRKPRKSGGKASSDANPFTSARKGEDAPGRKVMKGELGFGED